MEQGQEAKRMMRGHYRMFAANLIVSTVIMYLVMFSMIFSGGEFFNNLNFFYMALTMATPMGVLMLIMMRRRVRARRPGTRPAGFDSARARDRRTARSAG